MVDFTEDSDALVPYSDLVTTASWHHKLTELTESTLSQSVRLYRPDDDESADALVYTTAAGLRSRLTKRLQVNSRAGIGVITTEREVLGGMGTFTDEDTVIGVLFDLGLEYQLKAGSFRIAAAQDFSPSSLGELELNRSVLLDYAHRVNDDSGLSFNLRYSQQSEATGEEDDSRNIFLPVSGLLAANGPQLEFAAEIRIHVGGFGRR